MSDRRLVVAALVHLLVTSGCGGRSHEGLIDVTATSPCVTCHLGTYQRTTAPPHVALGYPTTCESCHSSKSWRPALGSGSEGASDPARDVTVEALIPSYSGTSIVSLTPRTEILAMPMRHLSPDVDAAALDQCASCHSGATSGTFFPGIFHASLAARGIAQPERCASCHAPSVPTGFVGPLATDPERVPPSGEMKHDAVHWDQGAPTSTSLVTEDCGTCHTSPAAPGQSWATAAVYHARLTAPPSSCLDCHASSRPTGVLTSTNAALPANVILDHTTGELMGDCLSCHGSSTTWSGASFHLLDSATPATCLPCHAGERPTTTVGWASTTYNRAPFDYVTNSMGTTHGAGQDCVGCHDGPGTDGAWGKNATWVGGSFAHGPGTLAGTTCLPCHTTQRPDVLPGTTPTAMATMLGFDHATNGTGDCFGCHQDTVTGNRYASFVNPVTSTLPGGDWRGGQTYPGSILVSSAKSALILNTLNLVRSGVSGLVTGMTSIPATLPSGMLHTASGLDAAIDPGPADHPDNTVCWHCHTSSGTTVTAYADGRFHAALTGFSVAPGGPITPLPQPTSGCAQCHAQTRPAGIVEPAGSSLQPMDHAAVADLDCSVCHRRTDRWDDGRFHASIDAASPGDCTACHYPTMADAVRADVTSGVDFSMRHRSGQITFQGCQTCHPDALANAARTPIASTLWKPGSYHAKLASQPGACVDCHAVSLPTTPTRSATVYALALGATSSNGPQWMSHASSYVTGRDCVVCHAADARPAGSSWASTTSFHATTPSVTACQGCHGVTNGGGATAGTNNNLPATLTNSKTATTASAASGVPAGTLDQIVHTDLNVSSHDCGFCHTQVGVATGPPVQGKEWAQARFHLSFTPASPLVINGTTGRCSNCHMNVRPGPSFAVDHSSFTATSTRDCGSCHSFPGTGSPAAPNWLGAAGAPATITVGGFAIPQPPAPGPTTQAGINNLPHPASGGTSCTSCHATAAGGRSAIGYDHASSLINANCGSCHEAGTDLLGTRWNGATTQASGAGDSRPFTLASVRATYDGDSKTVTYPNHFYPADCGACHYVPPGNGTVTTGTAYTNAWRFRHPSENAQCVASCRMCHAAGCPD